MKGDMPEAGLANGMTGMPVQRTLAVRRWVHGTVTAMDDQLAEEVPVALEYNGISHAVMLATPADLEDFAIGFSLTEGIVGRVGDIYGIDMKAAESGITLRISIASAAFAELKARRRALAGRTGCGLCGTESLDHVLRIPPRIESTTVLHPAAFERAFSELHASQALLHDTGATHAAAWMRADGEVTIVREDVGRHNALDKLAGALARSNEDRASGATIVTSRASYEMVLKTASIGTGILAAVSGPTGLAVRLAEAVGVTLVGFVRNGSLVVYAHPQRLRFL
ncbi:formate dehydrogenase accessory sulfurtransferase FdhD [Cupriavidus sp. WKF15]|uniref:formate dehydrogenase accessory sulfurtransferase FdhD n=1 Tax=Cupriavidus sp. WKF15 TaxID=3032282 RepID=UPI0023E349E6|nr:formate dehydrogenase accessory sulfurtransferase FdhD [Cupriavidus sp. WKF15]WER49389.1 formate dehydrogenase accessory sulfurtransferase FdhD [Cupriavidus sp. WKF15]